MDKHLMGLIGAMTALAAAGPARAATAAPVSVDDVMQAGSYADLLKPIPNAVELLHQSDMAAAAEPSGEAQVIEVQYHHHHHHHHRYYRRRYHHHHHHHAVLRVGPIVVR